MLRQKASINQPDSAIPLVAYELAARLCSATSNRQCKPAMKELQDFHTGPGGTHLA
jgi:hypothetical protein